MRRSPAGSNGGPDHRRHARACFRDRVAAVGTDRAPAAQLGKDAAFWPAAISATAPVCARPTRSAASGEFQSHGAGARNRRQRPQRQARDAAGQGRRWTVIDTRRWRSFAPRPIRPACCGVAGPSRCSATAPRVLEPPASSFRPGRGRRQALFRRVSAARRWDLYLKRAQGRALLDVRLAAAPMHDPDGTVRNVAFAYGRHRSQGGRGRLRKLAHYDPLTGLPIAPCCSRS